MANEFKIYSLSEPDSEEVRYIGLTSKTLEQRLMGHMYEKHKCHRRNWIIGLKNKNQVATITLIEDGLTKKDAISKEKHYIKFFKSMGARLVNSTLGGEGIWGYKRTEESKRKQSERQKGKTATLLKMLVEPTGVTMLFIYTMDWTEKIANRIIH